MPRSPTSVFLVLSKKTKALQARRANPSFDLPTAALRMLVTNLDAADSGPGKPWLGGLGSSLLMQPWHVALCEV